MSKTGEIKANGTSAIKSMKSSEDFNYSQLLSDVRKAYGSGRTRDVEWRVKQLESFMRMLDENREVWVDALYKDLRKPRIEALGSEIDFLKNSLIGILREIREWAETKPAKKSLPTIMDRPLTKPEPYGVALILGAWNYPVLLSLEPMMGAIAAGNCVIVKPSEISPAVASTIERLIPRYLDKECFRVVNGGVPETTALLKERFDYIFYTGSTMVGKIIAQAAAKHLTPVTLELGGKSPTYVADDVNLEVAAKRILWGKTMNCGQTCIAPDYILCSKHAERELVRHMKSIMKKWYGEKPKESNDQGRIVSERHFDRIVRLLQASKGKVELGGNHDRQQKYIDLTIVTDVTPNDSLMQEEIFGPILPFVRANSAEEAVEFINEREKPLALYLFTEERRIKKMFEHQTSSGSLAVNECLMHMSVESIPFGGVGNSGYGAYHGKFSFDTFTHYKGMLVKDCGMLGERIGAIRYPPYNDYKIKVMTQALKNRKLPDFTFLSHATSFALGVVASGFGVVSGVVSVVKNLFL